LLDVCSFIDGNLFLNKKNSLVKDVQARTGFAFFLSECDFFVFTLSNEKYLVSSFSVLDV